MGNPMNAQLTRLRAEQHIAEPQRETHAAAVGNSRLHRSELAVPGSNVRMLEKAPALGADVVMLDLEDAVAPDDKEQARINVIEALKDLDWSRCSVSMRINGLETHYCYRDIVEVVEEAGQHLDTIMIPKAGCAGDIQFVATLLTQIEDATRRRCRLGIAVLIETAMGMVNCDEIARACPERMEAMVFGVADYAASLQSHTTSIGGASPTTRFSPIPIAQPSATCTGVTSGTTRYRG
jgi:malyl-CoA/(S)-citramalyl-CoA lyase